MDNQKNNPIPSNNQPQPENNAPVQPQVPTANPDPGSSPPAVPVPPTPPVNPVPPSGLNPESPQSEGNAKVVIPGKSEAIPKWFYIFFVLVIIIFVTVTALLVMTIIGKNRREGAVSENVIPTEAIRPTIPLPTVIPTGADEGVNFYDQQKDNDIPEDIEADLNQTDTSYLQEAAGELDTELGTL